MLRVLLTLWLLFAALPVCAASRSEHFLVEHFRGQRQPSLESKVAQAAEAWRTRHLQHWFGEQEPKPWPGKAEIRLIVAHGNSGGGASSWSRGVQGQVIAFYGTWEGEESNLIANVVPHEVMHFVLAGQLDDRIPTWLHEGISTYTEGISGRAKLWNEFARAQKWFSPQQLFGFQLGRGQYPSEQHILVFYGQSYAYCEYIAQTWGEPALIDLCRNAGDVTTLKVSSVDEFHDGFRKWIRSGGGPREPELYFRPGEVVSCSRQGCTLNPGTWLFRDEQGRWVPLGHFIRPPAQRQSAAPAVAVGPPVDATIDSLPTTQDPLADQSLRDKLALMEAKLAEDRERIRELVEHAKQAKDVLTDPETDKGEKAIAVAEWGLPKLLGLLGVTIPPWAVLAFQAGRWGYRKWKGKAQPSSPPAGGPVEQTGVFPGPQASAPVDTVDPPPRDLTEALELVRLGRLEGRDPLLDSLVGQLAQDILDHYLLSGEAATAAFAKQFRADLRERVNAVAPLELKGQYDAAG